MANTKKLLYVQILQDYVVLYIGKNEPVILKARMLF